MRVELGSPVVIHAADVAFWHIPVATKPGGLEHVEISIDDGMRRLVTAWPAVCGETGELFVYGGFIRRRRLCRGCAAAGVPPAAVPPSERAEQAARAQRFVEEYAA